MRLALLSVLFILSIPCSSQTMEMDSLRQQMFKGDITALKALSKYLNSKKVVTEFLGHHILNAQERHIASRYISESCYFEDLFSSKDETLTREIFNRFLASNEIIFNENTGYFTLKNHKPYDARCILHKTQPAAINLIKQEFAKSLPSIMIESGSDWSYRLRNSQCLLLLAEYFLKQRTKWNIYYFNDEDYVKSFRFLTHMDFAVLDEDSSINSNYRMTSEFKRQNLYSYFYSHYNDYKWDDSLGYFVNFKEEAGKKDDLLILFETLQSKNDTMALSAFMLIGEEDPAKVTQLSKQFSIHDNDDNFNLPTFTYRFLPVIAELTTYFRRNGIIYKPSGEIKKTLESLLDVNEFKERLKIEDYLIANATMNDIYVIEYFGLIYENNFENTYSMGRVLDKWYSKNWNNIVSNKNNLEAFLKKATKFDQLGIIGICNKYLRKFESAPAQVLDKVKAVLESAKDHDIILAANTVLRLYQPPGKEVLPPIKEWDGEKNYRLKDPGGEIQKILVSRISKDDKENKIEELSGKISYQQIGVALKELLEDSILENYSKFNFLESDFGLYLDNHEKMTVDSFLKKYNSLSQKDLYLTNLYSLGILIEKDRGEYDYNKMYEILKFDVVDAFVGGGGSRRDKNVYQVIKLLELKFGTTLGFINKLCSWQGIWGCECTQRAKYWMKYLVDEKIVSPSTTEPVSISYND